MYMVSTTDSRDNYSICIQKTKDCMQIAPNLSKRAKQAIQAHRPIRYYLLPKPMLPFVSTAANNSTAPVPQLQYSASPYLSPPPTTHHPAASALPEYHPC